MKNSKSTRKALFASALSLVLSTSMLIGTTWAWFTDSAVSSGNTIQSGTLNIDLAVKQPDGNYKSVKENSDKIFDYDKWEPGYTYWTNVKVKTEGNLALKYTLKFVGQGVADAELAKVIDVYYSPTEVTKQPGTRDLRGLRKLGTLADVMGGGAEYEINDTLIPEENNLEDFATIALKMQESAGNEYQDKSIPAFDLAVVATQYTYEEDTFDNQYDANAAFPVTGQTGFNDAASTPNASVPLAAGSYTLPSNMASGISLQGSSGGTTTVDTVNVSGANTGTFDNVTADNITFNSSSNVNLSTGWNADWDGIISHNDTLTDSTFTNCTFSTEDDDNRVNAIYGGTVNGTVTFDGCTIYGDVYGMNYSYVNGTLIVKNSTITGWNSFGKAKTAGGESKVIFENCTFEKSNYFGMLRFYQNAEIKNCTFSDDFEGIDVNADGCTITITDSPTANGKIHNNGSHNGTWIVDGNDISDTVTAW